jgi:subtilisin family serine protease
MLHEWSDVQSTAMDGSTNLETAMDELSSQGMLQVTPMGNLNTSGKHTEKALQPGQTTELGVNVTDGLERRGETQPYRVLSISLYWRKNDDLDLTLESPSGETLQLDGDSSRQELGSATVVSQFSVSPGGTHHAFINAFNRENLPQGQWSVSVGGAETAETLVGRLGDGVTTWRRGLVWNDVTTDHGTLCYPASADSAVGVAAYGAKGRGDTTVGELQEYSSRGPRIDGASVVDVAAPSDAWTALGVSPATRDQGFRRGWFRQFGGTSGAGPHVAGAAALVKGAHPDWSSSKIKQELRDHAVTSSLEPFGESLPNRHWGAGKIDAYKTLTGESAPEFSKVPSAAVQVDVGSSKVTVDASGSSAPQGGELDYRFDVENDGEWDTSWRDKATAQAPRSAYQGDGNSWARVEVRTKQGLRDGALTAVNIQSDQSSDSQNGGSSGGCGGCRTSGTLPVTGSWLLALAGLMVARFRRNGSHEG